MAHNIERGEVLDSEDVVYVKAYAPQDVPDCLNQAVASIRKAGREIISHSVCSYYEDPPDDCPPMPRCVRFLVTIILEPTNAGHGSLRHA